MTAKLLRLLAVGALLWYAGPAVADPPKKSPGGSAESISEIRSAVPIAPRSNVLTNDPWTGVSTSPLTPAELDRLIADELRKDKIDAAPKTTDEQFLRRVYLDLTGRLPLPADISEFAADADPAKRERVIDRLLASEEYAKHWSRYWRDVVASRFTDRRTLAMVPSFEAWLDECFKTNRPWDQMAREMITSDKSLSPAKVDAENGSAFFLLAHMGEDQVEDRTAETSRIFLGVQIQCARCHDHVFDAWKQTQFHELAGYFARLRTRTKRNGAPPNIELELASLPRGEHSMPGKDDPSRGTMMPPKFLNGAKPPPGLSDKERRNLLAKEIAGPESFWFAAAFANRTWGDLMGQAFIEPIDDLGPGKLAVMPGVLTRLAASFKGTGFDIKTLMRTICLSETYQRQIRPGETADTHLRFSAAYPTRLPAEALWQSLVTVLGQMNAPPNRRAPEGAPPGLRRNFGLEGQVVNEFRFDPSLKADEVEGSIPQALLLMNNAILNQRIRANNDNLLARVLDTFSKDEDAVRAVYLRTLARKPSDVERSKALAYVKKVDSRKEAFEDVLWALLNSTEFLTKR